MKDQIRKALDDLNLLSLGLSGSDQERVLRTLDRFKDFDEKEDYIISLYEKLSSKSGILPRES